MNYDVCIVGAGAAGITLAHELAATELRVCVLETGDVSPSPRDRGCYQIAGVPGATRLAQDLSRPSYLGGATNYWYGNCRPFEPEDLNAQTWLKHSGWPLTSTELTPYYRRAHEFLGLGDLGWYDPERCRAHLPRGAVHSASDRIQTRMVQTTPRPKLAQCYRRSLAAAPRVDLRTGNHVLGLEADASGRRVIAVRVAQRDGSQTRVQAGTFVLACGGVENARLMLLARDTARGGQLPALSAMVGRCLMEHLYFTFDGPEARLSRARARTMRLYNSGSGGPEQRWQHWRQMVGDARVWGQWELSADCRQRHGLPGMAVWLRPKRGLPASLRGLQRWFRTTKAGRRPHGLRTAVGDALRDPWAGYSFARQRLTGRSRPTDRTELVVQLEQTPSPSNRVRLASTLDRFGVREVEIDCTLDTEQCEQHKRSLQLIADDLDLDGQRLADGLMARFEQGHFSTFWHHMGTTRMGSNPDQGVVDHDALAFGTDNLFVAGSSVFPTGGTAGPTLTIVALAMRLSDHLRTLQ